MRTEPQDAFALQKPDPDDAYRDIPAWDRFEPKKAGATHAGVRQHGRDPEPAPGDRLHHEADMDGRDEKHRRAVSTQGGDKATPPGRPGPVLAGPRRSGLAPRRDHASAVTWTPLAWNSSTSSPVPNISRMMSQPPTNSPLT